MADRQLRGVLIGCGFFAKNHMHAWASNEHAKIVALCDIDVDKANAMAKLFGVEAVFTDAATMLENIQPDFVDIATTPPSHRQLVELACKNGCAIICQKPFSDELGDAVSMVATAQKAGVTLIVHENFRWQAPFVTMKNLLDQKKIGTPHFARFSFRHGYDNYKNQPYLAQIEKFSIMDVGLHLFDLARHFMGEVSNLSCTTQSLNPVVKGEDAFTALLKHQTGATSICDCSFYSRIHPEPFPNTLAWIEGDQGTLQLEFDQTLTLHTATGRETISTSPEQFNWGEKPWLGIQDAVISFQRHAIATINGNCEPQPSGSDNLKTLALAFAAYEAAKTATTINMANFGGGKI